MVGLGIMGAYMAERLVRCGHRMIGYDHGGSAVPRIAPAGASGGIWGLKQADSMMGGGDKAAGAADVTRFRFVCGQFAGRDEKPVWRSHDKNGCKKVEVLP